MKSPLFLALAACLLALGARAQSPATSDTAANESVVPVVATPADTHSPKAGELPASAGKPLSEANCVRHTGSRIRQRGGKDACNGQPGRSYTKDELDRTGHTDLGDALRALDPAVR